VSSAAVGSSENGYEVEPPQQQQEKYNDYEQWH